jgi:hypothetical protein
MVSGLGTSPWAGSHFGPVAGPSFPQASLHFHPCNSFRQEQLWVRVVTVGWFPSPSFDALSSWWRWALQVPSLYCWTFYLNPSLWVPRVSHIPSLWCILEGCPQPPISWGYLFPFFLLALRASVLFPHSIPYQVPVSPSIPVHFPSQVQIPHLCCFSQLKRKGFSLCMKTLMWASVVPGYLGTSGSQSGARMGSSPVQPQKSHLESHRSGDHSLPCPGPACPRPCSPVSCTFVSTRGGHKVEASLNFPFPYKVMSSSTWNSSSCKWGIPSTLAPANDANSLTRSLKGFFCYCQLNKLLNEEACLLRSLFLAMLTCCLRSPHLWTLSHSTIAVGKMEGELQKMD